MNSSTAEAGVARQARQGRRRTPSIDATAPDYLVLSHMTRWMQEKGIPGLRPGRLLDYGCGGQPFRGMVEPHVAGYAAVDVEPVPGVRIDHIIGPGDPLPYGAGEFATVLSTQVLEHVADPARYLDECARVLQPQGRLILFAPMQWRHHEVPWDYWRFTRFGLTLALERAGFAVLTIDPCGGCFTLIGQILLNHLWEKRLVRRPWIYRRLNGLFLSLDRRYPDPDETVNWMCLAEKK